ncbi:MAG: hypothetical protein IJ935_15880 [Afipia sp.]|nr:hypothetical protein [Afipia sp.]
MLAFYFLAFSGSSLGKNRPAIKRRLRIEAMQKPVPSRICEKIGARLAASRAASRSDDRAMTSATKIIVAKFCVPVVN